MIVNESQIRDCKLGEDVSIVNPVNMYECIVGPFTQIGPFVEIQKDAVIGAHCKIQSHTFICSKVFIGHYCFIGHGVIFTNDTFANGSPNPDPNSWKATFIDSHVTISCYIQVNDYLIVYSSHHISISVCRVIAIFM